MPGRQRRVALKLPPKDREDWAPVLQGVTGGGLPVEWTSREAPVPLGGAGERKIRGARSECRIRQYGGTANIWSERWKVLTPFDLRPKPGLEEAGWPIGYEELEPHYRALASEQQLEGLLDTHRHPQGSMLDLAATPGLSPSYYITEENPVDLRDRLTRLVERSPNIFRVLGANVAELVLDGPAPRVRAVEVRSWRGGPWMVRARWFVLACGAIENARILLNSRRRLTAGIGNGYGWVGRNLLDHPKGSAGWFECSSPDDPPRDPPVVSS